METSKVSDEEILGGLQRHPGIRSRVAALLAVVEDSNGDLKRADDAEDRLIEEMRRLGQEKWFGKSEQRDKWKLGLF